MLLQKDIFLKFSNEARITLAAAGAQLPFSIKPTVRLLKFFYFNLLIKLSAQGKTEPS